MGEKIELTGLSAGFREIEHTADRAITVWAPTPDRLYEEAARGMFSLMVDLTTVPLMSWREVDLPCDDLESGLVDWLNELLYWRETQKEMYRAFEVSITDEIHGRFGGGPAFPQFAVIKAVTFHGLRVTSDAHGIWRATIVFDT